MKKIIKKITLLSVIGFASITFAQQNGNPGVGIQTDTPTETLDVNGRARIQNLPKEDEPINTLDDGTKGTNTFKSKYFVFADKNGVLGKIPKADKQPTQGESFNDSKALFVIKKYKLNDWPSGPSGQGVDTKMDTNKWDAMLFFRGMKYNTRPNKNPFDPNLSKNGQFGVYLTDNSSTYRIVGDVSDVSDNIMISILFIKKGFTSTITVDER